MISVIIPVYNVKPFLNEAVESVISQSFTDWEMILVDDGSTDGCPEICDNYALKDSRIKVIHQKNRGLSAARNAGLDLCRGDYIAFLDSDDYYYPDLLSTAFEAMQKHNTDIVEFNISIAGNSKGLFKTPEGIYSGHQAMIMQVEGKISTAVWNKLYKRGLWESLHFSEGRNYEDLDIILPLIEKSESIYIINKPLIAYRLRKESITFTNSLKNHKDFSASFSSYAGFIETHIPEYFSQEHLEQAYYSRLKHLIVEYCSCPQAKIPGRKPVQDYLRKEIDECRTKVNFSTVSFKTKAALFLLKRFPASIPPLYRLYHNLNKISVKKIF